VLFPLRPNIKQLNREEVFAFWPDKKNERLYYVDFKGRLIYRSDFEGEQFRDVALLPQNVDSLKELRVSPDSEKLLFFNQHQLVIVYLDHEESPFVLEYPRENITNAFWHSDSYHIIMVTGRDIQALEARPNPVAVILTNVNRKNVEAFYDDTKDTIYFLDSQKASDGRYYNNLYKMELTNRTFPFQDLIRTKENGQGQGN
jgi:hypothetical protein